MTLCRFCARIMVSNPATLKSIVDPVIQSFLNETSIILELEDEETPMLICKMCEMTAKNYFAFVEKIKKNQEQFEKPKLPVTNNKRFMPAILKGSKRKQTDQIVGTIGNSTVIRLIENSSEPAHQNLPHSYLQRELQPEKVGESSKTKKIKATKLKIFCRRCKNEFESNAQFFDHFRFCLENDSVCPLCYIVFRNNVEMTEHYFVNHLIDDELS